MMRAGYFIKNRGIHMARQNQVALLSGMLLLSCPALSAIAAPEYSTLDLKIKPEKSAEFLTFMKQAAVDTRAHKGCQYFAILVDASNPAHVVFYEIWDSKADHEAYRAWRNETKFGDKFQPFLAAPPAGTSFTKFDD
jgi:quinol monooxygenase YgiN